MQRIRQDRRGVSNIIVIVLSFIVLTIIVSQVVLWSYQMNQSDWERMHEDVNITDVARVNSSSWYTAQSEYTVNVGSRINGSYTNTQAIDNLYESFSEELSPSFYYPSSYRLLGSTSHLSSSLSDLASNNGIYMIFRSYASAASVRTLYAHQETTTISGTTYRLQALNSADASGTTSTVSTDTLGRKMTGKFVYQLTGVSSIIASTWTIYYRTIKSVPPSAETHADVDIIIRKADGTIRTTIATNVANSGAISSSWSTLSGTYAWAAYTVVDQTDYLEIDYYIEVTNSSPNKTASLRIDDNNLAVADQTRATNVYLPSEFTSEVEFTGSSDTQNWNQLSWTVDSAWTAGSVSVTLQLYNYTLGNYPTSGNGYVSYTSSGTANTDETKTQTITQNPNQFRNATGYWKMKIKGMKTTTASFDFKADWITFSPSLANGYQLDLNGTFRIDLSTYPSAYVKTGEILLRCRASDVGEKWYLKSYNWTKSTYSDSGFNSTTGHTPTTEWSYYAVNLTDQWNSYVQANGTVNVKVVDEGADGNKTTIDIDFLAVRVVIDGTTFTFESEGSSTCHLVSLWINNSTNHQRYDIDIIINSGDAASYFRGDIILPNKPYTIKVVTERGNIAIYPEN